MAWGFYYHAETVNPNDPRWSGRGQVPPDGRDITLPSAFDSRIRGGTFDGGLVFDTTVTAYLIFVGRTSASYARLGAFWIEPAFPADAFDDGVCGQ